MTRMRSESVNSSSSVRGYQQNGLASAALLENLVHHQLGRADVECRA